MPNWEEVLNEINHEQIKGSPADTVRWQYLEALHQKTGRNIISYYSGWLSKPEIPGLEIRNEDRDGFMRVLHGLDHTKGLDLILHTPGGSIAATHSIINYLQDMFNRDIRAFVPHTAMSAGTIMALSCKEIFMGKHSCIGAIDPQLGGISASGVLAEFKRIYKEILKDQNKAIMWGSVLNKYTPGFITQCENAIKWSTDFSRDELLNNMFLDDEDKKSKVNKIIKALTANDLVKLHERQISPKEALEMGIKIKMLEDDPELQDLVLTVHHCFVHTFSITTAYKIIENHSGDAFIKALA